MVKKTQRKKLLSQKKEEKKNEIILAGTGLSFFIIDQIIKIIFIKKQPEINLQFIKFHYVQNTGASFSILQGQNALLLWIGIIAIGIFLFYFDKIEKPLRKYGNIIMFGVISNTIDRVIRGGVIDYINLGWFPVFNIADALISIGAIILFITIIKEDIKK
jgi:signal peptidase II